MFKKSFLLAVVFMLWTAISAQSACTAEEAQVKGQEFMNAALVLAQKDASRYQQVVVAMQTQLPELQKVNDFEGVCKFYDEWTEKMK